MRQFLHHMWAITLVAMLSVLFATVQAQTPGTIYKPAASSTIRAVLDANGDGFISTSAAGFSGTDFGAQSELKMIALPVIGAEPSSDVSTGGSGSHTDIVSNITPSNQSVYVLYKKVGTEYYLIFRFRVGGASTAAKGYSVLFDTDGVFGSQYPSVPDNPGFEKEVVMETGPGGRIGIYNHSNAGASLATSFPLDSYSQRSVAVTNVNGTTDYFYDFCVPYPSLDLAFDPVRTVSVTITSANSGLVGTKADFNGINDKLYGNDPIALAKALIASCPPVSLTNLVEGYNYPPLQSAAPVVNGPIRTTSTSISGTSAEDNGTIIKVYKNGTTYLGQATVTNNEWTLTGVSGLEMGEPITATATAANKSESPVSAAVLVERATICYTNRPVIASFVNGTTKLNINWANPAGTAITANSIVIKIYDFQTGSAILMAGTPSPAYIVAGTPTSTGTVQVDLTGINQSQFSAGRYVATATVNSCESGYSDPFSGGNYTIPTAPEITTTTIIASPTVARSVSVTNKHTAAATIALYIVGQKDPIATSASTIAANASTTFTYTGFATGDTVTSRAIVSGILSARSNSVLVVKSTITATPPVITGTYNTASTTVTGTSVEAPGSTIYLYANGVQIGTATVSAGGGWTITGLNLSTYSGQLLTARVEPLDELISPASNAVTINPVIAAPSVNAGIMANQATVAGTAGNGTVTVFVDGASIGSVGSVSGSWTLSGVASGQLYKGANVTATNTVTGVESPQSGAVTVVGLDNFLVTTPGGSTTFPNVTAGQAFDAKFTGRDVSNNTFTTFTGTGTVSSSLTVNAGGGTTGSFSTGVLTPHSLTLTRAGTHTITVINSNDPTARGTATVTVVAGPAAKLLLNSPADITPNVSRATYTVTLADSYDNAVNASSNTVVNLTASAGTGTFYNASSGGSVITSITIPGGSSSATFYFNATAAGSYTVDASTSGLSSATDNIIAGFVWQGDVSIDWGTAGNWEGNSVPPDLANVIIPQAIPNWPTLDVNRRVNDLFVVSGGTVTLNGKTLTINGTLTGTGQFKGSSTSGLEFTGTGSAGTLYVDQTTSGTTNLLNTFTINRTTSGLLYLGSNLQVTTVALQNGIIDIQDATLTVSGLDATHIGTSTSYLKTSGVGLVKKSIANAGGSFKYPVGNSTFNPVTITNNTSVASEVFGVQVIDDVYSDGNGRGNQAKVNTARVARTWEITKASSGSATGTGVNFLFEWNSGETEGFYLNVNALSVFHHARGGAGWGKVDDTKINRSNVANKKISYNGYTGTFSPFSLQQENSALPVIWGALTAKAQAASVELNWNTITEIDSKDFVIQHSADGIRWNAAGTVLSAGDSRLSNSYSFIHQTPSAGNNYYRIMERSITGAVQYSSIVSVNMPLAGKLVIFGNPVTNGVLKFSLPKSTTVTLNDAQGRIIYRGRKDAGIQQFDLQGKASGLYYLKAGTAQRTIVVQ